MSALIPDRLDRLTDMLLWRLEVEGFLGGGTWLEAETRKSEMARVLREVLEMGLHDL